MWRGMSHLERPNGRIMTNEHNKPEPRTIAGIEYIHGEPGANARVTMQLPSQVTQDPLYWTRICFAVWDLCLMGAKPIRVWIDGPDAHGLWLHVEVERMKGNPSVRSQKWMATRNEGARLSTEELKQ